MEAFLITVGSELLSGSTLNTNAAHLARELTAVGLACQHQVVIGDAPAAIVETITSALRRSHVVVISGGLGPTCDDVTIEAIGEATGRALVHSQAVSGRIRRFYRLHQRRLQPVALRQARLPRGALALPNPVGTAPGIWLPLRDRLVIALPGVPREMRAILARSVLPRLRRLNPAAIETLTIRTVGLVELEIEAVLQKLHIPGSVEVGLYPRLGAVDLRFTTTAPTRRQARQTLATLKRAVSKRLGESIFGYGDETLEETVGRLLVRRRARLALAESCTGGLLCDRLTDAPGSSRYVRLAIVAYHNRSKQSLLGVPQELLSRFGAVSEPVARAMAHGVRRLADATVGLAITGIAGPSGGSRKKPVGLVYVALDDEHGGTAVRRLFHGDRTSIKYQATQAALDLLRRWALRKRS